MDTIEHTTRLHFRAPKSYLEELLRKWMLWAPGDGRGSTGYATKESLIAALKRANLGALAKSCKFIYKERARFARSVLPPYLDLNT